jgi:serine/threonine protein kinase
VVLEATYLAERATLVALAKHAYHPNVVKYFGVEEAAADHLRGGARFVYLALEQCAYSLHDLFHPPSRVAAAAHAAHAAASLTVAGAAAAAAAAPAGLAKGAAAAAAAAATPAAADRRLALALGGGRAALVGSRACRVAACEALASALAFLHRVGVVHGDLRPRNVLFAWDGTLKLSDFGLSRQLHANPAPQTLGLPPWLPSALGERDAAADAADDDASFSWDAHSGPTGGGGWFAPEVYRRQRKTRAVDLFGLG